MLSNAYEACIKACESKVKTPPLPNLAAKSVLAGMYIAIGSMMLLLVKSDTALSPTISSILSGFCFSIGLFAVMTCSGELFTGDCLMILGYCDGKYGFSRLIFTLFHVFVWNFVGAAIMRAAFNLSGMNVAYVDGIASVAAVKESMGLWILFGRSALCNLLVCVAVWIGSQTDSVVGKLFASVVPVTTFVALGFEHSVANMFLYWTMEFEFGWTVLHLAVCTFGNMVGGIGFGLAQYYAKLGEE